VIPRAHIVAWRSEAPWPLDSQVEQDLALSRAIIDMFQVTRSEMSANLEAKLADPAFVADLGPLLAPGTAFDVAAAASRVRDELINRIR
jgi:hypothetical protein